jgi:mRNA turnover protein 4
MPKSKRSKLVSLTRIEKKNCDSKVALVEDLRECLDSYASIYTFSVSNMRNAKLKDVRQAWKHSRFFFGKNKVMAVALGKGPEDEYKPDLHLVAESLSGNIGLLFTNKLRTEVEEYVSLFLVALCRHAYIAHA